MARKVEQLHPSKRLRELEQEIKQKIYELQQIGERTVIDWQRELILKQVVPIMNEAINELGDML